MRLIDLDAFEEQNAMRIESQGKEKSYYSIPFLESRAKVEAIPIEWIEKWRDEKGRHMSERLVAGKIIVDWKWSLSEEDRKKYGID